jgi:hypothetical protein
MRVWSGTLNPISRHGNILGFGTTVSHHHKTAQRKWRELLLTIIFVTQIILRKYLRHTGLWAEMNKSCPQEFSLRGIHME